MTIFMGKAQFEIISNAQFSIRINHQKHIYQSHCSGNIFIKIFNVMNYFPLEDQLKIKGCEQLMSIAHFQ